MSDTIRGLHVTTQAASPLGHITGTVDGEPYDIPEGYRIVRNEELWRGQAALELLGDLDRSSHGRHRGDVEAQSPTGRSEGNTFLSPGDRIGTTLYGTPIVVPAKNLSDPKAWLA